MHATIDRVTDRIRERSAKARTAYLAKIARQAEEADRAARICPAAIRPMLMRPCPTRMTWQAPASPISAWSPPITTCSAHQPYERYPDLIRKAAHAAGATAQVAGGVPAMCDGVTQGRPGMELSLFSRDVIALATGVALSHDTFDAALYLGVCDKIVPGLIIAAGTFGHIPAVFVPAGPMPSGLPNDEKSKVRQQFATGEVGREALMAAEMASYHAPGTCTFYGTANTNQMLMEFMGLHLPGSSFVNPEHAAARGADHGGGEARRRDHPARQRLPAGGRGAGRARLCERHRRADVHRRLDQPDPASAGHGAGGGRHPGSRGFPRSSEKRAADGAGLSPNGLADVNHFHAAGGLGFKDRPPARGRSAARGCAAPSPAAGLMDM